MTELVCPVHDRATVDGRCLDCLAEAADAMAQFEPDLERELMSIAAARAWAQTVLERYDPPRRKAVA